MSDRAAQSASVSKAGKGKKDKPVVNGTTRHLQNVENNRLNRYAPGFSGAIEVLMHFFAILMRPGTIRMPEFEADCDKITCGHMLPNGKEINNFCLSFFLYRYLPTVGDSLYKRMVERLQMARDCLEFYNVTIDQIMCLDPELIEYAVMHIRKVVHGFSVPAFGCNKKSDGSITIYLKTKCNHADNLFALNSGIDILPKELHAFTEEQVKRGILDVNSPAHADRVLQILQLQVLEDEEYADFMESFKDEIVDDETDGHGFVFAS